MHDILTKLWFHRNQKTNVRGYYIKMSCRFPNAIFRTVTHHLRNAADARMFATLFLVLFVISVVINVNKYF